MLHSWYEDDGGFEMLREMRRIERRESGNAIFNSTAPQVAALNPTIGAS